MVQKKIWTPPSAGDMSKYGEIEKFDNGGWSLIRSKDDDAFNVCLRAGGIPVGDDSLPNAFGEVWTATEGDNAPRYTVIGQALNTGSAVLDRGRKIAWFPTYAEAKAEADRLNAE